MHTNTSLTSPYKSTHQPPPRHTSGILLQLLCAGIIIIKTMEEKVSLKIDRKEKSVKMNVCVCVCAAVIAVRD